MSDNPSHLPPPDPLFCSVGDENSNISDEEIRSHLTEFLDRLEQNKEIKKVLVIPPDYTRYHSQAGKITRFIIDYYREKNDDTCASNKKEATKWTILPALGTHAPMTETQIRSMFGKDLAEERPSPFVVHDWREGVVTIGHTPAFMVEEATNGMVKIPWPAQLNKIVWEGGYDVILSVGQIVPHEVMGMANFNKNLFVGVGGVEAINLSHFIGAVYGMENMMGKADNPLRRILNYASEHFLQKKLPLWYIHTVMGKKGGDQDGDKLVMKGFYIGNDMQCYLRACELSLKVNFTMLDKPLPKVVVHLDQDEFHSTWLGNKAIYRTRMAIADKGNLIILAPGVNRFGEDDYVDVLIRKYGYRGTKQVMKDMNQNEDLRQNLSAVAHLIHGSSEGRFDVTYCTQHLSREEVQGVGFQYADYKEMSQRYDITKLKDGWNKVDGEDIYFISNPALGLWAVQSRFEECPVKKSDGKIIRQTFPVQTANDGSGGVGGWAKPPVS